ncbi:MAG: AEC family transporter, partial [Betaproteobacteria bacterium]
GGAMSALDLALWGPVDKAVGMLADAASPVALFTIGAVLFRSRAASAEPTHTAPSSPALLLGVVGIKLLLHPLLVWSGCLAARALGAPLSDLQVAAITLMAALPSASNVSMLAERYGANNGLVARIIMGSTTLAFITFTLWAWGFGVQPLH